MFPVPWDGVGDWFLLSGNHVPMIANLFFLWGSPSPHYLIHPHPLIRAMCISTMHYFCLRCMTQPSHASPHHIFKAPFQQPFRNPQETLGHPHNRNGNASLQILLKFPTVIFRFWKCWETLTFCSLLARCGISCACHTIPYLNLQKWSKHVGLCEQKWLGHVLRATAPCTFSTSQLPKVLRTWCALYILTSKCASRHNGVHYFDISTSKSAPNLVCFEHFDFEKCFAPQLPKVLRTWCALCILTSKMCFAPQRRALFRHLNFEKWSENGVFWCALYFLTSTCASRHNSVQFFISHLARGQMALREREIDR